MIPILLLCRNNKKQLEYTVNSILQNTLYEYKLYVVDNNSTCDEVRVYLSELELKGITVYRNKTNLWIIGLNKALKDIIKSFNCEYVVVSDSDLIMPEISGDICWLSALINVMNKYKMIGKLGLSLDLENIKDNKKLSHIFDGENKYYKNKLFEDVYLAPVDTTTAIYRTDLFVSDNFQFYPGHGSMIKPFYFVGRLVNFKGAIHLGWEDYFNENVDKKNINAKVKCFTLVGGYVDKITLKQCSIFMRMFHFLFSYPIKSFWGVRVFYHWILYILKNKIVNLNEIYKKSKTGY